MIYEFDKAVTRQEAVELLIANSRIEPKTEYVPLTEAVGRVMAENVFSACSVPPYRVSAFDGYAVKAEAFAAGRPDTTSWVKGADYVNADTGDDFPDDFDAVVAVEDVSFDEKGVMVFADDLEEIKPGTNVRRAGSMLKEGARLASAGTKITPEVVAALAMGGCYSVPVRKRPVVAFLPTGTEIVPVGFNPRRGQYVDSNSVMVAGLVREYGGEPLIFPITEDNRELLSHRLDEAVAKADIVIINGGTSKGSEDFNSHLIRDKGTFFRHGVKAVPGRPVGISVIEGKPVMNIPGPVLACWLACDWLLRSVVDAYLGVPPVERQKVRAVITEDVKKPPVFEMLRRVSVRRGEKGTEVYMIPRKADIAETMSDANGLLVMPIGCTGYKAGEEVEVELFGGLETIK